MNDIMHDRFTGTDGKDRCKWCESTEQYIDYHDNEWGWPVEDDTRLFEKICLESFQSGLSWRTILTKRENFRAAFAGFDFHKMAEFDETDVERLLNDEGIVRHRGKIEAVINNAKRAVELQKEQGSLAHYFWSFEADDEAPLEFRATSPESVKLSKDLKKRGWKFVGPTTAYAFMQAMGLVNDHSSGCYLRAEIDAARARFKRP